MKRKQDNRVCCFFINIEIFRFFIVVVLEFQHNVNISIIIFNFSNNSSKNNDHYFEGPNDAVNDATTICRESKGQCDIAEHCDGLRYFSFSFQFLKT